MPDARQQLAEAIAGDACEKDVRRCALKNLKLLYLGCAAKEIALDLVDYADDSIAQHLHEHQRCGK